MFVFFTPTCRVQPSSDTPLELDIAVVFDDLPGAKLGEARIAELSDNGLPTAGTIVLDREAAGFGWFVDPTPLDQAEFTKQIGDQTFQASLDSPAHGKYDLLTVLLHETGHFLGFVPGSTSFDRHVVTIQGSQMFVGPEFTAKFSPNGEHLDRELYPFDLLNSVLSPSVRKLPTTLDFQIIQSVRDSATDNDGFDSKILVHPAQSGLPAVLINGLFDIFDSTAPDFGWAVSGDGAVENGMAVLTEDRMMNTEFSQTFIVPDGATALRFTLVDVDLQADHNGPPDAFDVALLDVNTMSPIVGTSEGLTESDGLFNIQQTGEVFFGSELTVPGVGNSGEVAQLEFPLTVEIDVTGVPAGTEATLYFDLLGFGAQESGVVVDSVRLITADSPAEVVDRHIFYNNSYFDGNDNAANEQDDGAITPDKEALRPRETAKFENYTSYSRGINGIMVDLLSLADPDAIRQDDFEFRVGNDDTPGDWADAPLPEQIVVRPGAGKEGSDRISITWADNAIEKQWLQVTVMANESTGLETDDVFYWGNAVGETGNSTKSAFVDGSDLLGVADHPRHFLDPAPLDDPYDHNRDRFVDGTDWVIVSDNTTHFLNDLNLITPLVAPSGAAEAVDEVQEVVSTADSQATRRSDAAAAQDFVDASEGDSPRATQPLDTNQDGFVSPTDVVMVFHAINRAATDDVNGLAVEDGTEALDVNGDDHISPVDALLIIRHLNEPVTVAAAAASVVEPTRLDIDHDGIVSSSDAWAVIDILNRAGPHEAVGGMPRSSAVDTSFDVNGDQYVSATDVLLIVRHLATSASVTPRTELQDRALSASGPQHVNEKYVVLGSEIVAAAFDHDGDVQPPDWSAPDRKEELDVMAEMEASHGVPDSSWALSVRQLFSENWDLDVEKVDNDADETDDWLDVELPLVGTSL